MKIEYRMIYVSVPSAELASAIGLRLVETGQVACANILPGIESIYRWEGAIVRDREAILIVKTVHDRVDAVIATIRAEHPYSCPGIVALPIVGGLGDYLDWIEQETRGRG
jgi:periplasmic divalent cation tolerance protein